MTIRTLTKVLVACLIACAASAQIGVGRLAAQFPDTQTQTARLVVVPIVAREQAQLRESQQLASLPSTASPLALFALGGLLSLGLGAFLTFYCRRR